jgi:plastocyanin
MSHAFLKGTFITALILLTALIAGCGGESSVRDNQGGTAGNATQATGNTAAPHLAPVQIVIDNFSYSPAEVTIPAGTKVTWVNHDDVPHTATSSRMPRLFNSKTLDTDEEFSFVFTAPGAYDYFCALHPKMTARIIVK